MQGTYRLASKVCVAASLILATSACDAQETPPLAEFDAVAFGRVETQTGQPVSGANVLVLAHFETCDDAEGVFQGVATTGENGFYQRRIKDFAASEVACVTAVADVPPIGEDARDGDSTVTTSIRLRETPPLDSARVDVMLKR